MGTDIQGASNSQFNILFLKLDNRHICFHFIVVFVLYAYMCLYIGTHERDLYNGCNIALEEQTFEKEKYLTINN